MQEIKDWHNKTSEEALAELRTAPKGLTEHHDFASLFMVVVGIAVAAIPEGLPAVLTIILAVGVKVMAHQNDSVRRLPLLPRLTTQV